MLIFIELRIGVRIGVEIQAYVFRRVGESLADFEKDIKTRWKSSRNNHSEKPFPTIIIFTNNFWDIDNWRTNINNFHRI